MALTMMRMGGKVVIVGPSNPVVEHAALQTKRIADHFMPGRPAVVRHHRVSTDIDYLLWRRLGSPPDQMPRLLAEDVDDEYAETKSMQNAARSHLGSTNGVKDKRWKVVEQTFAHRLAVAFGFLSLRPNPNRKKGKGAMAGPLDNEDSDEEEDETDGEKAGTEAEADTFEGGEDLMHEVEKRKKNRSKPKHMTEDEKAELFKESKAQMKKMPKTQYGNDQQYVYALAMRCRERPLKKEERNQLRDRYLECLIHDYNQGRVLCMTTFNVGTKVIKEWGPTLFILTEAQRQSDAASEICMAFYPTAYYLQSGDIRQLGTQSVDEMSNRAAIIMTRSHLEICLTRGMGIAKLVISHRFDQLYAGFVSACFYKSQLICGIADSPRPMAQLALNFIRTTLKLNKAEITAVFIDMGFRTEEKQVGHTHSSINLGMSAYVRFLAEELVKAKIVAEAITIITPYKGQVAVYERWNLRDGLEIAASTIDSFIGQDNEVVIVDLVRTERVGFIFDHGKLATACTRARSACFIMVDHSNLEGALRDSKKTRLYTNIRQFCQDSRTATKWPFEKIKPPEDLFQDETTLHDTMEDEAKPRKEEMKRLRDEMWANAKSLQEPEPDDLAFTLEEKPQAAPNDEEPQAEWANDDTGT